MIWMVVSWLLSAGLLVVLIQREGKRRHRVTVPAPKKWFLLPEAAGPTAPSVVELASGLDLSCFLDGSKPEPITFQYDPESPRPEIEPLTSVDVRFDDEWVTFIKRDYAAEMVEGMCHWVQNRDMVQHHQMHVEFHLTDYCPYAAMAAVLRGDEDPRGVEQP